MKKSIFNLVLLLLVFTTVSAQKGSKSTSIPKAKYIFYFIGDGMGLSHVTATESYLATTKGQEEGYKDGYLSFTQFPVIGLATTHSASNAITCSSAAGTALATGTKTKNGMLGLDVNQQPLNSIAYQLKTAGMKIGISSTVGINHATPAAFYGHNLKRGNYYEIGSEIGATQFDFFAGACILDVKGSKKDQVSLYEPISQAGYTIAKGVAECDEKINQAKKLLLVENPDSLGALTYRIDRNSTKQLNLSYIVQNGIDFLMRDNKNGFFLMAEAGAIDWAGHANDGAAIIGEVLDLSDAVSLALKFYMKYPTETLIVVTADHETGGLGVGNNDINDLNLGVQSLSKGSYLTLPKYEVRNRNASMGLGFTSTNHTGCMVPVYAIGVGSQLFSGKMDNTDIPKRIMQAAGVK